MSGLASLDSLLTQCTTEAEKFAVALAFFAGVTSQPSRVDIFPGLIRIRHIRTTASDTLYFVRNKGFDVLYQLWHKRWSNPGNTLLKKAKVAGTTHRR